MESKSHYYDSSSISSIGGYGILSLLVPFGIGGNSGDDLNSYNLVLSSMVGGRMLMTTFLMIGLVSLMIMIVMKKLSRGNWKAKSTKNGIPYYCGNRFLGGCQKGVFQSPVPFLAFQHHMEQKEECFYCDVFGTDWLFISNPKDISCMLRQANDVCDFTGTYKKLFAFLFPSTPIPTKAQILATQILTPAQIKNTKSNNRDKLIRQIQDKFGSFNSSSTPHIAHSVSPSIMKSWIPTIQSVFRDIRLDLTSSNASKTQRLDLFEFARVSISGVTTMLMIGKEQVADVTWLRAWTDIFFECNIEEAMCNPFAAVKTMMEVAVLGERKIYRKMRSLVLPIIDKEIERCINNEPIPEPKPALVSLIRYRYKRDCNQCPKALRLFRKQLCTDVFNFTLAAFGNSFATAGWILYHILKDTNGLGKQIRASIETNPGAWTDPANHGGLPPLLQNCILEVTRLYTPGNIARLVRKPFTLPSNKDLVVEAGTIIAFNQFHVFRNGYPNPLDFDPSRYDKNHNITNKNFIFSGFGMGSHPCVGKYLAMTEIGMFVLECLNANFRLVPTSSAVQEKRDSKFTDQVISIQDHPNLCQKQSAFIWRPTEPIYIEYDQE